ncbi:MAG: hypothetical protein FWH35_00520 [Treponema sp.]|nr:hypothetical protein [Treponema sp.]
MSILLSWEGKAKDTKNIPGDLMDGESQWLSEEAGDFFGPKWDADIDNTCLTLSGDWDEKYNEGIIKLLLRKGGNFYLSRRYPTVRFRIDVSTVPGGLEYFVFLGGKLISQAYCYSTLCRSAGFYAQCRIDFRGEEAEKKKFRKEISKEQKKPDFQNWAGKRLDFDRFYKFKDLYLKNEILDGEIGENFITFAANLAELSESNIGLWWGVEWGREETDNRVVNLFNSLAASFPALEFDMKYCADEMYDEGFQFVKKFYYKNGTLIKTQTSVKKAEAFSVQFSQTDDKGPVHFAAISPEGPVFYRFKLPQAEVKILAKERQRNNGKEFDI